MRENECRKHEIKIQMNQTIHQQKEDAVKNCRNKIERVIKLPNSDSNITGDELLKFILFTKEKMYFSNFFSISGLTRGSKKREG